jgi:putative ABC transport system permease protein
MWTLTAGAFRKPAFAASVIATLAVALGAVTLMVTLVNGVLLQPLPFRNADRLVAVINRGPERPGNGISPLDYLDWRDRLHSFDGLAAWQTQPAILVGQGTPTGVNVTGTSTNWFSVVGIGIALGRGFTAGDDVLGSESKIVVLSNQLWHDRFASNPHIVGRAVLLDNERYTVVGVTAPGVGFPFGADLWRPFVVTPDMRTPVARGRRYLSALGRLKQNVTVASTNREVATVAAAIHQEFPLAEAGLQYSVRPLRDDIVVNARPTLVLLLTAAATIFLIACANVTSLALARVSDRGQEIAVRIALGANRTRIVRDIVHQTVLLALVGAALGVTAAGVSLGYLTRADLSNLPRIGEVSFGLMPILAGLGLGALSGLVTGLGAGMRTSSPRSFQTFVAGIRSATAAKSTTRLRSALVAFELAVAVPLFVAAGLLGRSLERLMAVDPGFQPEHVVRFDITLPDTNAVRMRNFTTELMRRLNQPTRMQQAAAGFAVPFSGRRTMSGFHIAGHPPDARDRPSLATLDFITPDYFAALHIPILAGRTLTRDDGALGRRVLVVNSAFVNAYLDGEDPLGTVLSDLPPNAAGASGDNTIVGVVGDSKSGDLTERATPMIYLPYDQYPIAYLTVVVRSARDSHLVLAEAQRIATALDPEVAVARGMTLDDAIRLSVARPKLEASVVGGVAVIALFLAVIGIYSLVTFVAGTRTREIGIRIALGAQPRQAVAGILAEGIRLTLVGLMVGTVLAVATEGLLRGLLYGVSSMDPATYAIAVVLLTGAALVGIAVPARRAATTDAVAAMRSQ